MGDATAGAADLFLVRHFPEWLHLVAGKRQAHTARRRRPAGAGAHVRVGVAAGCLYVWCKLTHAHIMSTRSVTIEKPPSRPSIPRLALGGGRRTGTSNAAPANTTNGASGGSASARLPAPRRRGRNLVVTPPASATNAERGNTRSLWGSLTARPTVALPRDSSDDDGGTAARPTSLTSRELRKKTLGVQYSHTASTHKSLS